MRYQINRIWSVLGCCLLLTGMLILTGCSQTTNPDQAGQKDAVTPAAGQSDNGLGKITNPAVRKELASLRAATAKYHDVEAAIADGYIAPPPEDFVPGMGYHYVNLALAGDGEINLTQPEVLVYAPLPKTDSRKLVAVEYLTPRFDEDGNALPPPEGFTGDMDHWHVLDEPGLPVFWAVHAWVWEHNPEGMFHETNPRIGSSP